MLLPMVLVLIYFSVVIASCNKDIATNAYETYTGICTYESEAVYLAEAQISIYVGKGHEIVPPGDHYGKCIYSKRSKVIVDWQLLENTQDFQSRTKDQMSISDGAYVHLEG